MQVQLKPLGDSQGICLPNDFLAQAGFQPGDFLQAEVIDDKIVLSKVCQHRGLKERAAKYGGQLDLSEEYAWGRSEGDEVWE